VLVHFTEFAIPVSITLRIARGTVRPIAETINRGSCSGPGLSGALSPCATEGATGHKEPVFSATAGEGA
jgi:hypothetical protein